MNLATCPDELAPSLCAFDFSNEPHSWSMYLQDQEYKADEMINSKLEHAGWQTYLSRTVGTFDTPSLLNAVLYFHHNFEPVVWIPRPYLIHGVDQPLGML